MTHEVFISHAHEDRRMALALCAALQQRGIRCWIAPRDVPPGHWAAEITRAIKASRALVLVFSEASNHSPAVRREVHQAVDANLPIVPVSIAPASPSDTMQHCLAGLQWVDGTGGGRERFREVANKLKAYVGRPGFEPAVLRQLQRNRRLFAGVKVFVIGDLALDRTFRCRESDPGFHATHGKERHYDIEPFPQGDDFGRVGGSNTNCLLAATLGATPSLLTITGKDQEGQRVAELLTAQGLEHRCLALDNVQTVTRIRWFVWNATERRYFLEFRMDKEPAYEASEVQALKRLKAPPIQSWIKRQLDHTDALLLNDTQKGFLSRDLLGVLHGWVAQANERRRRAGRKPLWILVDPKNDWQKFATFPVDVMKANHLEACRSVQFKEFPLEEAAEVGEVDRSTGRSVQFKEFALEGERPVLAETSKRWLRELADKLHHAYRRSFRHIVVTLGGYGVLLLDLHKDNVHLFHLPGVPARATPFRAETHCGDVFATALTLAMLAGESLQGASVFANYVASLQFAKPTGERVTASDVLQPENLEQFRRWGREPEPWPVGPDRR